LFLCAPLAESEYAPVSETGSSGFESRVGHQIFSSKASACDALFYNLDVAKQAPPRAMVRSLNCGRAAG
jgi:hypothetical protein